MARRRQAPRRVGLPTYTFQRSFPDTDSFMPGRGNASPARTADSCLGKPASRLKSVLLQNIFLLSHGPNVFNGSAHGPIICAEFAGYFFIGIPLQPHFEDFSVLGS